ncbi:hypothetical protein LNAOJCKE_2354 [Methylorubrum aminovorans]|uniref:Secreted protein n=1 Tax=Methylorubrum aminovorans TaxID=269069 RepID=A0ABQ4UCU8_9HYPH|nr:hypothetical protein [Methylorubrum aminovorans]GJE65144.1 hypothetical protein LNAOJCKE_2354 [Methylorubrum aminovorans]GMA73790.1 hypothetical protein GCM10025880_02070 [Methylorubrum aminovorans]
MRVAWWSVFSALLSALLLPMAASAADVTTVRTESFPRPPYSGATYYVYERSGRTICTKLAVCNKFNKCETTYVPGAFRAPEDTATGEPYGTTPAVPIASASLAKHVCLTRFGLARR